MCDNVELESSAWLRAFPKMEPRTSQTTFWFSGFTKINRDTKYSNDMIQNAYKVLNRVSHSPQVAIDECVEEKNL